MVDGAENINIQEKQKAELIKQIRAVNAVLGMSILPLAITEDDAPFNTKRLAAEYPVRFAVYQEVSRFIRESTGSEMKPLTLANHSKRISEWRNRIFYSDKPKGYFSIGEFLNRPEFTNSAWNKKGKRLEVMTLVRNKLSLEEIYGIPITLQGYKTVVYTEEDLRKATAQLP